MPPHLNVEIKARCADWRPLDRILMDRKARFLGEDHQVDTYFESSRGRLKLREGKLENHLIFYRRPDRSGPKPSAVFLYPVEPGNGLRELLSAALGIWGVVEKRRRIYFIENVKFHLDQVNGLGSFVEIEAIGSKGTESQSQLEEQCRFYLDLLGISPDDLIDVSYSDLLLKV